MPESPNQATSRQRRANWVGLRTLRQVPKVVGEMAGGETVYEVRSVRLVLDASGGHFVRVTSCSRCGRELPGTPVMTPLDLDRPLRPMICSDCIRQAGVSTVWDADGAEPGGLGPSFEAAPAGEKEPVPAPAPAVVEKQVEQLELMERHLRAVTDRVNELGRVARAQQVEGKTRAEQEDAAAAAFRSELGSVRAELSEAGSQQEERAEAATAALRSELVSVREALEEAGRQQAERAEAASSALRQELASVRAALDETRAWAQDGRPEIEAAIAELRAAGSGSGAGGDVTGLARQLEAHAAELARIEAAVVESRTVVGASTGATRELARAHDALDRRLTEAVARFGALQVDATSIDGALITRLAEAEGRLFQQIAGQWGDLETAIESSVAASVAGIVRAHEDLVGGQAVLEARLEALTGQLAQMSNRLDSLVQRLASQPPPEPDPVPPPAPGGDFLDALDRQLDAATRRLAARSAGSAER